MKFKSPALWLTGLMLVVAAIIPVTWFEPQRIIFGGDPVAALDPVRFFLNSWQLWQGTVNLGAEVKISTVSIIHQFIQAIPSFLGASDRTAEIFHFSVWFALPGLTMAFFVNQLCRRLKINQWAVPVAVSYYMFNLYRVANFGDNNHFAIYAALPLALYWIDRSIERPKEWLVAAAGFTLTSLLAAQSGSNPPMYLMYWLPILLYGGILAAVHWREWRSSLKFWLFGGLGVILLNLIWLLPFIETLARQTGLGSGGNLNWLNDLSRYTSLDRVIRLIGAWSWFSDWRGEAYAPFAAIYSQPFWYNLSLIPAVLALSVLTFKKGRQPTVLVIMLIGLLGIAYAQGTHPPFGSLFTWSVKHLPFFWIFRSPWYKFSNMIAFSYAVLAGLAVGQLVDWLATIRPIKYLSVPLVAAAMLLPIVIAHPLLTGAMFPNEHQVKNLPPFHVPYPTHIKQAADWLNSQPGNTAVALLPYQGAAVYRWGYASMLDPLIYFSRRPLFIRGDRIGYIHGDTPGASLMYRIFQERLYSDDPVAEQVARLLGIEYVVVRKDINYEFYDDTDSPAFLKEKLGHQPGFQLARSFGDWDIYQLKSAQANPAFATRWVYADGHPLDSFGAVLASKTASQAYPVGFYARPSGQPNPALVEEISARLKGQEAVAAPKLTVKATASHYTITGQENQPFVLVLNQSMNSNWRAVSRTAKLSGPVVANGYAPAWLVEPPGQFTITIDYQPQRYVLPTALIALATLIILICLVTNRWPRKWLTGLSD